MIKENKEFEPRSEELFPIVNRMAGTAILVVGDIMLDRFVYGDVERISPEGPIPVLTVRRETMMAGGAGNVLANLSGLGVQARIVAVTGRDAAAETLRGVLAELGTDMAGLIAAPDRPTTIKTRFLAAHQQLLRTDEEKSGALPAALEEQIIDEALRALPGVRAVILSDYGKGVLSEKTIGAIIAAAKKSGVKILVDPKKADYSVYAGADIVTPNRKELSEAVGNAATGTDAEVEESARALMRRAGVGAVVATRSRDGMTVLDGVNAPLHLPTEAREVYDVSGAGDTVIATVAAAVAADASLADAARIANAAAGLVVAKVGTAPVRKEELLAALAGDDGNAKIRTADAALETVQRWRARGLKIGFTNGCFDILHAGHIKYLAAARERCDRLIVALNADESVRRLKGAERPVNGEAARAAVLAALAAVDMVVIFGREAAEDDKPLKLIARLKPEIYFKGGDYAVETLPETPLVRSYGGAVEIMPFHEGHSTTATINNMKKSRAA